ncbi:protoporphyrinogen oxidase [Brachybacterium sp. AOP25-B2-12]|uniref:protoporphyrinogen oxidase n=1 Tax=Brachybacterium sp. AOP25-B2-12 TaxID=3457710 RepID=UPI0040332361
MTDRTLVIGGGLAGLLAARRHASSGAAVTLVEASDALGGAIAALDADGIEVAAGAESFGLATGAATELMAALGLAEHIVSPDPGRSSRLVSAAGVRRAPRGALLGIPGRPLAADVRHVVGTLGALRAWAERFLPATYALEPGVPIGRYVRRRMGRRVAERLVAPVVGGVHSGDPETLELSALLPRLEAAVRTHGSLAAAVRALRPAGAGTGTAVRSLSPSMAALPRALDRELRAAGAELRTGTDVRTLRHGDSTWQATLADGTELSATTLILATPPDVAAALLAVAAPEVAAAIPEAPPTPVRLVALVLDAPALDGAPVGTGALVAPGTPGIRAKALTHMTAKWPHLADAAAPHHIVRLSYGRPGETLPADDDALPDLALADASAILGVPLDRTQLHGVHVVSWDNAMRQSRPGHRDALDRLTTVLAAEAPHPPLELVGSWRDGTGIDALAAADRRRTAAAPSAAAAPAAATAAPARPLRPTTPVMEGQSR